MLVSVFKGIDWSSPSILSHDVRSDWIHYRMVSFPGQQFVHRFHHCPLMDHDILYINYDNKRHLHLYVYSITDFRTLTTTWQLWSLGAFITLVVSCRTDLLCICPFWLSLLKVAPYMRQAFFLFFWHTCPDPMVNMLYWTLSLLLWWVYLAWTPAIRITFLQGIVFCLTILQVHFRIGSKSHLARSLEPRGNNTGSSESQVYAMWSGAWTNGCTRHKGDGDYSCRGDGRRESQPLPMTLIMH